MKNILPLLLLLLCTVAATAQAPSQKTVTFMLHTPGLPDTAQVYITGNAAELGNWDPGKVKMERSGADTWQKEISLQDLMHLEYKYTLGSWEQEAADSTGSPLRNFTVKVESSLQVKNQVTNWRSGNEPKVVKGGVTGKLAYHEQVGKSGIIPARDLVVWLPPNYEQNKKKRYPVLYLHDGQNLFDPNTSSFGVDWRVDETADSLIRAGAIEPIIIVGINNTEARMQEYVPGEKGAAYVEYVVNTVKPFIDSTYRTKPGAKYTATGGSSAGGTIAFVLAWEHPNIFSKAICMSPAFKIQQIDYVDDVLAYQSRKKPVYFYIDNGGVELEEQLQPGIDEMLQALKQKGYREGKDFTWVKDENAKHFESAWGKRMPGALKLLFPAK
ncbi:alpha/beta hydrolase-fold protein [Pontibacter anaerobius]|uniref:Alpha/beta hydrolase-fold protein n=1 Tax=Pontibacter anaerobius TaxID=2993940 RepID=A0ABT3R9J5_9BACT|nr:alpha/beta hydrolase-fold protein [Pontibacter anaerobius]MCX2738461.1 alpha/beta hydrolase-fold protein [Pontibacter anaerobius]